MSVYDLYPEYHEFEVKLDLKKAFQSMANSERLCKNRETRLRIMYVLIQRFVYNRTLKSIANELGVTKAVISRAEAKGLHYLRHPKHGLKG